MLNPEASGPNGVLGLDSTVPRRQKRRDADTARFRARIEGAEEDSSNPA